MELMGVAYFNMELMGVAYWKSFTIRSRSFIRSVLVVETISHHHVHHPPSSPSLHHVPSISYHQLLIRYLHLPSISIIPIHLLSSLASISHDVHQLLSAPIICHPSPSFIPIYIHLPSVPAPLCLGSSHLHPSMHLSLPSCPVLSPTSSPNPIWYLLHCMALSVYSQTTANGKLQ